MSSVVLYCIVNDTCLGVDRGNLESPNIGLCNEDLLPR